jgi:hypothetical protein
MGYLRADVVNEIVKKVIELKAIPKKTTAEGS